MERIPLFKVAMSDDATPNVADVLESGYIGQGPVVEVFEESLQDEMNLTEQPVTVNSCTSALSLALDLCNVQPDDIVLASPATCFASNTVILHKHANIKWVDVDENFCITPEAVEKALDDLKVSGDRSKVKAIMAVDWAGRICDYRRLKAFDIPVIEDAAHVGLLSDSATNTERGDITCYSFQAIKFLTTGDGGLLVANKELQDKARLLRWYGLDRTKGQSFRCAQNIEMAGYKYHMNDIAASIGLANIDLARKNTNLQGYWATQYSTQIDNPKIKTPEWYEYHSWWLYSMWVDDVDKFTGYMNTLGIEVSPVHYRNDQYDITKRFSEDLPGVDNFQNHQVCIPVGWWLDESDFLRIVRACNAY